ncbi:hypothetical protein Tco_0696569 [Tanacetum coccineum]
MNLIAAQQVALDNALVAPEKRLKIEKYNMRIEFNKPQREPTFQVTLDVLKLSPCYPAFLNTVEVPEIYMHQFWNTIKKIKDTYAYQFKLDKPKKSGTLASVICYLRSIHIKCTSPGEHLLLSSIGASLGSPQMIDKAIQDSKAYKIYLAIATREDTPKKARKFKKIASPSKKQTLVLEEEPRKKPKRTKHHEPTKKSALAKKDISSKKPSRKQSTGVQIKDTPGVSVSKKKAPATTDRSKGIDLLFKAALLEDAQMKKVVKRSKRETRSHQASGLGDGVGS